MVCCVSVCVRDALYEKRVEPPYRPEIGPGDYLVDDQFLDLPIHSPVGKAPSRVAEGNKFHGFTYDGNSVDVRATGLAAVDIHHLEEDLKQLFGPLPSRTAF